MFPLNSITTRVFSAFSCTNNKRNTYPDEFVVLGGHGDSTGCYPSNETIAPGADDNASGITALTEVLRLYSQSELKPKEVFNLFLTLRKSRSKRFTANCK